MSDDLPGCCKRQKTDGMTGSTTVNLAQVQLDWTNNTPVCHETEEEHLNSTWSNPPVVFIQHSEIQQCSKLNFSYISEVVLSLSTVRWVICETGGSAV
eukprot:6095837-Ditylum_brightwellii.AAC.1